MKTPAEASVDPTFAARGVFDRKLNIAGKEVQSLPLPIAPEFRSSRKTVGRAASLGESNEDYGAEQPDTQ